MPGCQGQYVNELVSADQRPVSLQVELVGGCVAYTYKEEPLSDNGNPRWVIAQGIPPGVADLILQSDVARVVGNCRAKNWVIGEIGLDYSGPATQRCQRFVLAEFFRQVSFSTGMILVVKGHADDPLGRVPMQDCLTLLDGMFVPTLVPLFLRNFSGGPEQVKLWLDSGRPVFLGISGQVSGVSEVQLSGVRAVPVGRLLVESDGPDSPCGVVSPMSPRHIGEVYKLVSAVRGQDFALLAGLVYQNYRVFFGPQESGSSVDYVVDRDDSGDDSDE
ncbi:uncharacterized protein LOC133196246 [Saccostrea echinata]|uniref:uncharacterized protein LOC133196246 n=1 Tax=Saccostrea echinata TaxID=191078 RepID=UPI002A82961B|nr:uncharacterized protein LOC133196246 [Saccostrea echinata]